MSILDVLELGLIDFLIFLRDAVIYNNLQSDKGIEWLDNAWILENTTSNRQGLRDMSK